MARIESIRDSRIAGLGKGARINFRAITSGIGRYAPDAAYARGLADLKVWPISFPRTAMCMGSATSIDAG